MDSKPKQILLAIAAFILSDAAWFYGTGLHPYWILTWLAPLPILLAAPRLSRGTIYAAAFFGFAIGGLNVWSYGHDVAVPLWLALVAVIVPALVFAGIVLIHRRFILRGQLVRAAFALPVLWTAFEYLLEFKSPHSTWGNFGYTQMNLLPLIQIASITGIWAISFTVFLFAGTVAAFFAPSRTHKGTVAIIAATFYITVFGYGAYRLHTAPAAPSVKAGLISDDTAHPLFPDGQQTVALAQAYASKIPAMVAQGAQVIVLPEKIGRIEDSDVAQVDAIFEQAARQNHATIFASFQHQPNLHQARLYSPNGTLEALYEKHHMLPAFEGYLLPGTTRVIVDRPSGKWGTEICKDMDFPLLSRQYGNDGAGLMLVPAWDFVVDGWLHSRMAILRGVESGFSIARSAKQGFLSVSDIRGRVLAQQSSNANPGSPTAPFSILIASVPVRNQPTFYARTGNWFAWLDLILAAALLASIRMK
ncbi:MAG: nitrilase-related carbon-nitrogen hydrolase [Silvibacterium sp.]